MIRSTRLWTALAWLAGWAALTAGAWLVTDWRAALAGAGVLLLGLGGLRPLLMILWHGLAAAPPRAWGKAGEEIDGEEVKRS